MMLKSMYVWCLLVAMGSASSSGLANVPWPHENCKAVTDGCRQPGSVKVRPCDTVCQNGVCFVSVGVILPLDDGDDMIVNLNAGIRQLQIAEEEARSRSLLQDINITYVPFDDQCQPAYATLGSLDAYTENCVQVIFGLVCDYCLASVGRITKFMGLYGTPLITPGGFTFDFTKEKQNCNDEYFMVINAAAADYRSLSEYIHHYMLKFDWKLVSVMYEKYDQNEVGGDQSCQLLQKSVMEEIKKVENLYYHDGDLVMLQMSYMEYLTRVVGVKYGIITLCASWNHTRRILLEAEEIRMMDRGEYVFFSFDLYNNAPIPSQPWYDPDDLENNERARHAYKSLFIITPWAEAEMGERNQTLNETRRGQIYLDSMYEGMLLFSHALNDTITDRDNFTLRGIDMVNNMYGRTYLGKYGDNVTINCNGLRASKFAMMQMNPLETGFHIVSIYNTLDKKVVELEEIVWVAGEVPPDTPTCGYDNSKCPTEVNTTLIIVCVTVGIFLLIVTIFLYRRYKLEADIASMTWKVDYDKIHFIDKSRPSLNSANFTILKRGSQTTMQSDMDGYSLSGDRQLYTRVGYYKSIRVAVKEVNRKTRIELTRAELLELKVLRDLSNDHLIKFHGASINEFDCCILTEYCSRGSLQDMVENEKIKLDWMFKLSLIQDIVAGMRYLHSSDIRSHGKLKSSNCVVDSRFVLKITDFGMQFLRHECMGQDNDADAYSHSYWERQLWTAPELLRMESHKRPPNGTQKGDIYSFSIIVHEIMTRQGVFYLNSNITKKEIVEAVQRGTDANVHCPLRPFIDENTCVDDVAVLMKSCWAEEAADRPDFGQLKTTIQKLNKGNDSGNLLDNLLSRMEQYANNLETLVDERTADYLEEKKKCEELLYQLLPKSVAHQLISGESVIAETFDQVTIYFSDIVGFTTLSAQSTPLEVVDLLNDLYTCFDSIIENFDVYKVETIGDAYMVVSGLPIRNDNQHAHEIARMSLALLRTVRHFRMRHRPAEPLRLRIGMHTGPCVAGVVGLKMPRYCLFGDTVNTASRMESTGEPWRIHVSPVTKRILDRFGTFDLECRGEVPIKGKGSMITYWLNGERPKSTEAPTTSSDTVRHLSRNFKQPQVVALTNPVLKGRRSSIVQGIPSTLPVRRGYNGEASTSTATTSHHNNNPNGAGRRDDTGSQTDATSQMEVSGEKKRDEKVPLLSLTQPEADDSTPI